MTLHPKLLALCESPWIKGFLCLPSLIPRVVSSLRTPESLPDLLSWDSDGVMGDIDSDAKSPPELFSKSPEARCWIKLQEQEAVALCSSNMRALGSVSTSPDAGEEPPLSSDGGERERSSGDGDLGVSAGSGTGGMGSRCVGVSGLRMPPSDDKADTGDKSQCSRWEHCLFFPVFLTFPCSVPKVGWNFAESGSLRLQGCVHSGCATQEHL